MIQRTQLDPNQPAFPNGTGTPGMSMRAYLATQALQGILAGPHLSSRDSLMANSGSSHVEAAVQYADELIAELNKTEKAQGGSKAWR
jgi:hypothetical protein